MASAQFPAGCCSVFCLLLILVIKCVSAGEMPALALRTAEGLSSSQLSASEFVEEQQKPQVAEESENFMVTDKLTDGEFERRIHYNGLKGKETSLTREAGQSPITLWQLTNGQIFYQIIYNNGYADMMDCEIVRRKDLIQSFVHKFDKEVEVLRRRNSTHPSHLHHHQYKLPHLTEHEFNDFLETENLPFSYQMSFDNQEEFDNVNRIIRRDQVYFSRSVNYEKIEDYTDLPNELVDLLNFKSIRSQCDEIHQRMKDIAHGLNSANDKHRQNATESLDRHKRAISDIFLAPNTKWCGKGQGASRYSDLGGSSRADKCCRKHDHCKLNIHAMQAKWNLFNYRPFTISHCHCDRRKKRDIGRLFLVPGTKWCGKGWIASKYSDMGGHSRADRCCRQHDKFCPFWIMGFETRWQLFNWRMNTLMHCKCDERFRTCLKMADSSDANLVGNLFFNIVQTKCFVLKPEKYCKSYNVFKLKCDKKGVRKRAHLKDNRKF